jgi:DNA repair exonuclease SbcCD ATPase subunit
MRLSFVSLCGFRGFRTPLRIDFAEDFTIIDGRNGVGKSTIFDAIEFALTGDMSKYGDAKALRESVSDYVWWVGGGGDAPNERFVEVGFVDSQGQISVRRTPLGLENASSLQDLSGRLCDLRVAPAASISQLCTTSIIRDEQITGLSLDMGETDRYTLLRDALGASDAEKWITRAGGLVAAAKRRTVLVEKEVNQANADLSTALRRLDEARASLASDEAVSKAAERLREFTGVNATADQLAGPTRERIAKVRSDISGILWLTNEWPKAVAERARQAELHAAVQEAEQRTLQASEGLAKMPAADSSAAILSEATAVSRDLVTLIHLGRHLGLHDGRCPLCAKGQSAEEYAAGLVAAEKRARLLDENATKIVEQQEARARAEAHLAEANQALAQKKALLASSKQAIESLEERTAILGFSPDVTLERLSSHLATLRASVETAEVDLRVIETLRLNQQLETAKQAEATTRVRLEKAQERFGRARKVEVNTNALYDAARRAAAETLDRRLERVLPLMAELYRRLRPHPMWSDIEYSIRGDVRRFLKLQVGEGLNPQFMFSSGQRRATGLAFLLSVNLSLAWSRWKTLLLDDPVQHIDDFRSVHLAEVLAQLLVEGRQIICAVEDPALADLLGRRLLLRKPGSGKRITLGADDTGALSIREQRTLQPLVPRALVAEKHLAAS